MATANHRDDQFFAIFHPFAAISHVTFGEYKFQELSPKETRKISIIFPQFACK